MHFISVYTHCIHLVPTPQHKIGNGRANTWSLSTRQPCAKAEAEQQLWVSNIKAGVFVQGLGRKVKCTVHKNLPQQAPANASIEDTLTTLNRRK